MSGGLIQLVAYGQQDIYLTSSPQITFFQVVYRRHTNFSMESMQCTFNGTVDFGRKATCLVPRNGDLIHKAYLEIELPAMSQAVNSGKTVCWAREIGHVLIDEISVDIGGTTIDKHFGIFMSIWNELTQVAEKMDTYRSLIGDTVELTDFEDPTLTSVPDTTIQVPLNFWFCRNPGLALPLIALMYHEVKFNVSFRPANQCYVTSDGLAPNSGVPVIGAASIYIDYIFLDTEERKMFSQQQHEYLIEQLQYNSGEAISNSSARIKVNFSHPTKALIWTVQPDANILNGANRFVDWTDNGTGNKPYRGNDTVLSAKIQLNTQDRLSLRNSAYFSKITPYFSFTRGPATGIYAYSFALQPENITQPSGSCNMSRIESTTLQLNLSTGTNPVKVHVFALSWNVLRVTSGLGGLAYAS